MESEDYLITAERIPSNRWDTPANVYIITAQEIEDNHYQTVAEALSHINGIVIEDPGVNAVTTRINEGYRVLLLVDGHRVNTSQGSEPLDEKSDVRWFPSVKMIERIEIVKGGSSALYGTDAVDGVINIITKKGTRNETTIDIAKGTWNRNDFEFTNQGIVGKFGWFVTGSLNERGVFGYKNEGYLVSLSEATGYKDKSFSIRLDQKFNERNSITFTTLHRQHEYCQQLFNNSNTDFLLSYNFKENTVVPGWLRYFDMYNHKNYNIARATKQHMRGVEYQNGWEIGRHKIIIGAEWHQNQASEKHSDYPGTLMWTSYDKKIDNLAFYAQDKITLGNKWTVIPGVRFDHTKEFGTQKSPKIAVNYRADDKTKFYTSWGRVYRTPTIGEMYEYTRSGTYNRYYVYSFGGYYSNLYYPGVFNPMTYESGHTETIGVEHNFNDNVGFTLNFFNSSIKNAVTKFFDWDLTGEVPSYYYFTYNNNPDLEKDFYGYNPLIKECRGMEVTFHQKIDDHFSYNLGYTHTNLVYYSTQPNTYRLNLHYKNRGLKMNLLGIMASGLWTEDVNSNIDVNAGGAGFFSSRQAVFDFNCSYDFNENATIYFKANNFTNQNFNGKGKMANLPGRAFIGGVTFRF